MHRQASETHEVDGNRSFHSYRFFFFYIYKGSVGLEKHVTDLVRLPYILDFSPKMDIRRVYVSLALTNSMI